MLKELSTQGKIYLVCQLIYFILIMRGLSVLKKIKKEIKKQNKILFDDDNTFGDD